jgi:IS30 family transposase
VSAEAPFTAGLKMTSSQLNQTICLSSLRKKPNKDYAYPKPKAKNILTNRTYEDYLKKLAKNDFFETVQMDTVLGKRGSKKVILTMFFTNTKLLLAFILKSKTVSSVHETISLLNQKLAPLKKTFFDFAPVILLDNGSEFADPLVFEMDNEGEIISSVFYCTPYTATQRPQIERAHVELRRFLPKGSSFDDISQEQLNFILSHLNSYKLSSLNGKSPYQVFSFSYGDAVLDALGLRLIPDYDIVRNNKSILRLLNNI